MEAFTFQCSICGDSSTKLCLYCTKDACDNHLCERCHYCSDCCLCDLPARTPEAAAHTEKVPESFPDLELPGEDATPRRDFAQNGIITH
jgi:hypothetical protein